MVKRTVLLTGFFRVFLLYDAAEAFDLERPRRLVEKDAERGRRADRGEIARVLRGEAVPVSAKVSDEIDGRGERWAWS